MKKILAVLICLATTIFVCACNSNDSDKEKTEAKDSNAALTIGILPDTQSIPIVVADHFGYFAEEGCNINVELFASAAERDSALQSGNLQLAISDIIAACLLRQGDFPVVAVSLTDGSQDLLSSPESGITNIEELRGKTLAMSQNTIMEFAADTILNYYGLDPNVDVEKTYIPQMTVRMEMLINSQVDAVIMPEPQSGMAMASNANLLAEAADLGIDATCIIALESDKKNEKNEIEGFFRAYNKAVEYLQTHESQEYMDFVVEEGGFPDTAPEVLKLPDYGIATAPTEETVETVNAWMLNKNLLSEAISYDELVNDEYLPQ
ncbi:MAG: MetQ/NlpA family ABC transporter substrate-binding protein [Bacillota bacterium]|nr:MetQ/NlpA family ABC transporter substrate-binding protein [Bacillota bacterium]